MKFLISLLHLKLSVKILIRYMFLLSLHHSIYVGCFASGDWLQYYKACQFNIALSSFELLLGLNLFLLSFYLLLLSMYCASFIIFSSQIWAQVMSRTRALNFLDLERLLHAWFEKESKCFILNTSRMTPRSC